MSLAHFSHEHPLILKEKINCDGDDEIVCYGCKNQITRDCLDIYTCSSNCEEVYLHKRCAEVPKEIQHPMHKRHPLTLHAASPYNHLFCSCDVCKRRSWQGFTYHCRSCKFDTCVNCAFENPVFRHIGHEDHTLTLMKRKASFECDACGTIAQDSSYVCNSCPFWMHKSCAIAPFTVELDFLHHHPLVLTYFLPDIHRTFQQYCMKCKGLLNENKWLYYCHKCTYFVHMKCIPTSSEGDNTEDNLQGDNIDAQNLVNFPVLNKESFIGLIIDLFTKGNVNIKLEKGGATTHDHAKTLEHWSHKDHPLVLLKEAHSINEKREMLICNGCVQPISAAHPMYGCIECNFFLHKFCAHLPGKLLAGAYSRHAQHPLFLYQTKNKFSVVKCVACGLLTNGFYYRCMQCDIRFDMRCCFLPNSIKHESHEHSLNNSAPSKFVCAACGRSQSNDEVYVCESSCGFKIHKRCALLPSQMSHRWDPHPVSLIYPPFFHQGQIYCEICEDEVNPNYWLYHCHECDQTFHTYCIRPLHNAKVGDKVIVDLHEHALTYLLKRKIVYPRPFLCSTCNQDLGNVCFVFECANCDILFCANCVNSKL